MDAGREMNALVAERVLGLPVKRAGDEWLDFTGRYIVVACGPLRYVRSWLAREVANG
jgi:hypothetical protein